MYTDSPIERYLRDAYHTSPSPGPPTLSCEIALDCQRADLRILEIDPPARL
jgi:hypothetical protein